MNLILTALIFKLAQTTLQASLKSKHCLQEKHGNEICENSLIPDSIYSVKPYGGLTLVPRDVITQNGGISQDVFDVKRSRTEKNRKVLVLVSKKVYKNILEKDIKKAIVNYIKQTPGDKKKLFFFVPILMWTGRIAVQVALSYAVDELINQAKKIKAVEQGMQKVEQGMKVAAEKVKKGVKDAVKKVEQGVKKG